MTTIRLLFVLNASGQGSIQLRRNLAARSETLDFPAQNPATLQQRDKAGQGSGLQQATFSK